MSTGLYKVVVSQTFYKEIEVKADDSSDAFQKAKDMLDYDISGDYDYKDEIDEHNIDYLGETEEEEEDE